MAARDLATWEHADRVRRYALALARQARIVDEPLLHAIEAAALLHDIGKLAIPDSLLYKPGPLTPDEYDRVKQHAVIGADLLAEVAVSGPLSSLVRHHHENWDGSGYPDGRSFNDIPVGARVLSIADCYDALTSNRPYRRALSHDSAVAMIHERRGSMFDPEMTDAFLHVVWQLRPVSPAIYRPAKAIRPPAARALVLVGAASR
jgi:putative nucleotidyltransferase with HDIG domain